MPVVTTEQMTLLKEIQGSLPWIVNGVKDDQYRLSAREIREKLEFYKSGIEGFLVDAGPDYPKTLAVLLGLNILTFSKWANDAGVALPGQLNRAPRGPGRPRTEKQTPPEQAERIVHAEEKASPSRWPPAGEEFPADAATALRAQMDAILKYRNSMAELSEHYAKKQGEADAILAKYEELVKVMDLFRAVDDGTSV